jgi:hypothetical protein
MVTVTETRPARAAGTRTRAIPADPTVAAPGTARDMRA